MKNLPFPEGKKAEVPLLGDCFGMRKASRDRLSGKGKGAWLAGLGLFQLSWSSAGQ